MLNVGYVAPPSVSNRVKQGSTISPPSFSICVDALLLEIIYLRMGCDVGNQYDGVLLRYINIDIQYTNMYLIG